MVRMYSCDVCLCMCVCACVMNRVCVYVKERERGIVCYVCQFNFMVRTCIVVNCVCVCEREKENLLNVFLCVFYGTNVYSCELCMCVEVCGGVCLYIFIGMCEFGVIL
jgi:hypothetical protein